MYSLGRTWAADLGSAHQIELWRWKDKDTGGQHGRTKNRIELKKLNSSSLPVCPPPGPLLLQVRWLPQATIVSTSRPDPHRRQRGVTLCFAGGILLNMEVVILVIWYFLIFHDFWTSLFHNGNLEFLKFNFLLST
jgi:hypothetical protein